MYSNIASEELKNKLNNSFRKIKQDFNDKDLKTINDELRILLSIFFILTLLKWFSGSSTKIKSNSFSFQLIVTTHNSMICSRIGLKNIIALSEEKVI